MNAIYEALLKKQSNIAARRRRWLLAAILPVVAIALTVVALAWLVSGTPADTSLKIF